MSIITLDEFKAHFRRDFPFLPVWDSGLTYNIGDEVYYNGLFYDCKGNGVSSIPTTEDDWEQIIDNADDYIQDSDLTRAFGEADVTITGQVSGDQLKLAYKYLAAHYLVMDIKAATSGLQGGSLYNVVSRSVGSVSESYVIPERYAKSPIWSYLTQTMYGQKYLMMAYQAGFGNIRIAAGDTLP